MENKQNKLKVNCSLKVVGTKTANASVTEDLKVADPIEQKDLLEQEEKEIDQRGFKK